MVFKEEKKRMKDKNDLKTDHYDSCLAESRLKNIYELNTKYNG